MLGRSRIRHRSPRGAAASARTLFRVTVRADAPSMAGTLSVDAPGRAVDRDGAGRRTYQVRTYGCQMNVHDSERLAGLLEAPDTGQQRRTGPPTSWCSTPARYARTRTTGCTGTSATWCRPRRRIRTCRSPSVAASHRRTAGRSCGGRPGSTWCSARTTSVRCRPCWSGPGTTPRPRSRSSSRSRCSRPRCRPSASRPTPAWVSISVGCNNTCTFCIVPSLRGTEADRRPGDILAEVGMLVADGVLEVTLLGQNVNSYGVEFGDRTAFASLAAILRRDRRARTGPVHIAAPAGLHQRRDRGDGRDPQGVPQLHMPLQSGSDRVLKAMRRSYRPSATFGILAEVRAAMPDAAITTDIIVGFPGETDEDFEATLDVVRRTVRRRVHVPVLPASGDAGGDHGRPGADGGRDGALPASGRGGRGGRLRVTGRSSARTVEVLVAAGEGRKDVDTHRMSGRARDGRLVHFAPTGPAIDVGSGRRHRDHRGHRRGAAPPHRGRRSALPPPDHGRRPARRRAGVAYPRCGTGDCPRWSRPRLT